MLTLLEVIIEHLRFDPQFLTDVVAMHKVEVLSHPGMKIGNRLHVETVRVEEYSMY